jgi:hypothetical protein
MVKWNKCFHSNPDAWRAVNGYGLQLLSKHNLKHCHHKFPDEDGLQDEWEAAVTCPSKYVKLLVGQSDKEDLRVERDKENYFDNEY